MGDQPPSAALPSAATSSMSSQKHQHAFHAQMDDLNQPRAASTQKSTSGEAQPFDLRQMANALPMNSEQTPLGARRPSGQYNPAGMTSPSLFQYPPQMAQYGQQRHDPAGFPRAQQHQQHFVPQQMVPQAAQYQYANRPHPLQMQTQPHFPRMDPYAYGVSPSAYSPVDMRFPQQAYPMGYGAPAGYQDMNSFGRRSSETMSAAIPSLPRGPPRKPKQSGHALWVGNLPPAATVTDLKDHFSRDATSDIQSLFLISKSNCAFVNYKSEAACVSAMSRFHDSRFHGVRLVCRLRRGSASTTNTTPTAEAPKSNSNTNAVQKDGDTVPGTATPSEPLIVGGLPGVQAATNESAAQASATTKVPEKFFIVKSLTLQDLEASVRNGIWATQSHNESTLNQAFNAAENVYLIFSANKSGEYFGYARMCSEIAGEAVSLGSTPSPQPQNSSDGPKSIPTPATETAPAGRIIDDSARGTIFWEAETSDEEESASPDKGPEDGVDGQELGRPFKIEWISTTRLPFYRTRGLRNPWNANREVKIARDGTELEPSVGKRLVQMFHRPAQVVPPHPMHVGSMPPYQMG